MCEGSEKGSKAGTFWSMFCWALLVWKAWNAGLEARFLWAWNRVGVCWDAAPSRLGCGQSSLITPSFLVVGQESHYVSSGNDRFKSGPSC